MAETVKGNGNSGETLPYYKVEPPIMAWVLVGAEISIIGIDKKDPGKIWVNSERANGIRIALDRVQNANAIKQQLRKRRKKKPTTAAPTVRSKGHRKGDQRTSLANG